MKDTCVSMRFRKYMPIRNALYFAESWYFLYNWGYYAGIIKKSVLFLANYDLFCCFSWRILVFPCISAGINRWKILFILQNFGIFFCCWGYHVAINKKSVLCSADHHLFCFFSWRILASPCVSAGINRWKTLFILQNFDILFCYWGYHVVWNREMGSFISDYQFSAVFMIRSWVARFIAQDCFWLFTGFTCPGKTEFRHNPKGMGFDYTQTTMFSFKNL